MLVYAYIVESNPDAAYEVCKKYGFFQIADKGEMEQCLQRIVAQEGVDGFKDVMELHPDKDVLIELFGKKEEPKVETPQPPTQLPPQQMQMVGANGVTTSGLVNQTNTYILVGALIVAVAIISMKN